MQRPAQVGAAALVAVGILTATRVGKAFTTAGTVHKSTVALPELRRVAALPAGSHTAGATTPGGIASAAPLAACAALLCASALRSAARRSKGRISVAARASFSISTQAVTPTASYTPDVRAPASFQDKVAIAAPVGNDLGDLIDLASVPKVSAPVVQTAAPACMALPAAPAAVPCAAATAAASSPRQCRSRAARFVGGARRAHSQNASRATPLRATRRAVGAKLQSPPRFEAVPVSYDASKLRMKIQLGLRVSSCLRSERGRESKTPSASKGSDMSTGVRLQANEFRSRVKSGAQNDPDHTAAAALGFKAQSWLAFAIQHSGWLLLLWGRAR